jgi:UDP-glucose 4-epimerase
LKVLITGGAGFIGSHVTDKLLEGGHRVLIVDNYKTGRPENTKANPALSVYKNSISNKTEMENLFKSFEPEIVIHAAASFKDPQDWREDAETNILGTINIVDCAVSSNVRKFIYLQTSLCYGLHPLEKPITLDHPLVSGGSSYAISKTAAERYIELSGLDFISLRLANVYGPRNLSGPLPTFFSRITHDLPCKIMNTKRDFIFIDDVVDLIIKAAGSNKKGHYHASTGKDHSIKELFDLMVKYLDLEDPEKREEEMGPDDVATILLDPSRTSKDFDWKAITKFEDGVKASIDWYKNNKVSITYTHLKTVH